MTSSPYAEVIGNPVAHSKSPLIHRFWLDQLGLGGDYKATRVGMDELQAYFDARLADPAWRGCNITMPLKTAAHAIVVGGQPGGAPGLNGVNLAVPRNGKLHGSATDLVGILLPLAMSEVEAPTASVTKQAVVLGAGGVLMPTIQALVNRKYRRIHVVARSPVRVEAARMVLPYVDIVHVPWGEALPSSELLVNATPLGMHGRDDNPYDASSVTTDGLVFEMIYHPVETGLVVDARRRGLRVIDGLQMLLHQAAPSFEAFFGVPPPRERDPELRKLLVA